MVHSFFNDNHLDADNDVCDTVFCPGERCEECDNRFTFCLRAFGGSRNDDTSFCPLGGAQTTMTFHNSDATDFSSVASLGSSVPNPIIYTGNSWPV